MKARITVLVVAAALLAAGCAGDEGGTGTGPDLQIERRTGYAVIVSEFPTGTEIGFSADRDAESGTAFDVSAALWRIEDGPWNEPPVSCLGRGQRVELGIAQVQNEARPGLLEDLVVWVSCLASTEE
ncbi:MAG: hypothetical protein KQH83_03710 [Actinobacteria bacterium]|nr:hypothetical protein [Actinomycetota bacterium]